MIAHNSILPGNYLVFTISTGMEAAVVARPLIIEAQKCKMIFSLKKPIE